MPLDLVSPKVFPFFFVGLWLTITFGLAIASGWRRLAEHFRTFDEIDAKKFYFASGRISRWKNTSLWNPYGGVSFGGCLFVSVNDKGFRLSVFLPFGIFMRPLFIPWSAVESISAERLLWQKYTTVFLPDNLGKISLSGKPGQALLQFSPAQLRAAMPQSQ